MDESEDDHARKAAIEEMMRSERDRYFRDEAVQQEYRDILGREEERRAAAVTAARPPGPFDLALARYMEGRRENEPVPPSQATDESFTRPDPETSQSERRGGGMPSGANEFSDPLPATDLAFVKPALKRVASLAPNIAFGGASVEPTRTIADPFDEDSIFTKAEAAAARGNEALVMRRDDPARAVSDAPEIRTVPTAGSPDRPGKIVDARYKAQKAVAIADPQPITRAEAKELASKLHEAAGNEDSLRWFSRNMRVAFGPYATDVLLATFRFEDIDPKLKVSAAKMLLENTPDDEPTKLDSLIGREPRLSAKASFHNDQPAWMRPYTNPNTDLSRGDAPLILLEDFGGKYPTFAPDDVKYLWWYPETAPFFDDKYGLPGSAKKAIDGVNDKISQIKRRADDSYGKDEPMLPKAEEKTGPSHLERFMLEAKPPERPTRTPAFNGGADKSLSLLQGFQGGKDDPFPGKPPDSLPFEAAARAKLNQYRNLSRSRQDIPAALDRIESTFGAGLKFYKQQVERRKEEARKELDKLFLDVAYELTREQYEKANPPGAYLGDRAAAIVNEATDPIEFLINNAGGPLRWLGGAAIKQAGKYAPEIAKTISTAASKPFKGQIGKVVKDGIVYSGESAFDGAVADSIQRGQKMFTGEQEGYSPADTAKVFPNSVVEDVMKDAGKAGVAKTKDAAREWLRHFPSRPQRR